ncbi:MAG: NTP transferase domain-containing protein [Bryobacteraceae bacterium]|nr:NTP transferase domain-containing protein [Bryobacteraceae bacterium]
MVLAGGEGTRLRDLAFQFSGDSRPKQFCRFFGGKTLLSHTCERILPLFSADQTLFILTLAHEPYFRDELSEVKCGRKIVQPFNRGTAIAMNVCLERIMQQDEDALVAFFPSDHHYLDCEAFRNSVAAGLQTVEEYPHSVLLMGAQAHYPEVEYGWIEQGRTLVDSEVNPVYRVARFWEKPKLQCATLLQQRGCLWNTFITMGLASAFLELLHGTIPHLKRLSNSRALNSDLDTFYNKVETADFSTDVLCRVPGRLIVLQDSTSGWTDLGSPDRLTSTLALHESCCDQTR